MFKPLNNYVVIEKKDAEESSTFVTPNSDTLEEVEYGQVISAPQGQESLVGSNVWFPTQVASLLVVGSKEYFAIRFADLIAIHE